MFFRSLKRSIIKGKFLLLWGKGPNMKKNHPQGKGCGGNHGACTDLAAQVVLLLRKLPGVRVAPSVIQTSHTLAGGVKRVKITDVPGGLTLMVRQSRSVQELRVYFSAESDLKLLIACILRNEDI